MGSGTMFDAIAARYDFLNRVLSLGIDQRWRRRAVARLEVRDGGRVVDLATGTADLAITIARHFPTASVTGLDPSTGMLSVGREKLARLGLSSRVVLSEGDAQSIALGDDTVDAVSMAFGIRNVPDRALALREMSRITRPGGRVVILELSEPRGGLMGSLARFHVHQLVPRLGALLSGQREYRYLQRSIAVFPPAEDFAATMNANGLEVLSVEKLTFGVAHLYVATPSRRAAPDSRSP